MSLCLQYEQLVDQFKEVHREHESLLNSSYSTAELRKDMTAMEEERDLLTQRIAKSKLRVQANPGHEQVRYFTHLIIVVCGWRVDG